MIILTTSVTSFEGPNRLEQFWLNPAHIVTMYRRPKGGTNFILTERRELQVTESVEEVLKLLRREQP